MVKCNSREKKMILGTHHFASRSPCERRHAIRTRERTFISNLITQLLSHNYFFYLFRFSRRRSTYTRTHTQQWPMPSARLILLSVTNPHGKSQHWYRVCVCVRARCVTDLRRQQRRQRTNRPPIHTTDIARTVFSVSRNREGTKIHAFVSVRIVISDG